jgi:hypothetical protein
VPLCSRSRGDCKHVKAFWTVNPARIADIDIISDYRNCFVSNALFRKCGLPSVVSNLWILSPSFRNTDEK